MAALVLTCSVMPAAAQDRPKGDVSISYSILHDFDLEETFGIGWVGSVAGYVNDWLGVVGEVGGNYKTKTVLGTDINLNVHSFMAGARGSSSTNPRLRPFGQFLLGGVRAKAGALGEGASETAFALQPGGGVDFEATGDLWLRAQVDWRVIRWEGDTSSELRFAFGIVYRFGAR